MLQVGIRGNFLDYVSLCFSLRIVAFVPQVLGAAWRGAAQHIVCPVGNTRRSCSNLSLNLDLPPKQHSKKTA